MRILVWSYADDKEKASDNVRRQVWNEGQLKWREFHLRR